MCKLRLEGLAGADQVKVGKGGIRKCQVQRKTAQTQRKVGREEAGEVGRGLTLWTLCAMMKMLDLILRQVRRHWRFKGRNLT